MLGFERLSGLNKLEILDLSDNRLSDENVLSALGKLIISLEKPSLIYFIAFFLETSQHTYSIF